MMKDAVKVILRDADSAYVVKLWLPRVVRLDKLRSDVSKIRCLPAECFTLTLRGKTLCDQAEIKLSDGDVLIICMIHNNGDDDDDDYDDDGDYDLEWKQLNYDPFSRLSKEEVEWHLGQRNRVQEGIHKATSDLRIQATAMRQHFQNDTQALHLWDKYTDDIIDTFTRGMRYKLSCPRETPNSVLYDLVVKKKAHPKQSATVVGLPFLFKQATTKNIAPRTGVVAACITALFGGAMFFRSSILLMQQQTSK